MTRIDDINKKLVSKDAVSELSRRYKEEGKTISLTCGCFDLIHAGHVYSLARAASFGDILIVALNSDSSLTRLKGPGRPIMPENDRAAILCGMSMVDHVVIFDEDHPFKLVEMVMPDVVVKGKDHKPEDLVKKMSIDKVIANGGRLELIDLMNGRSTTNIVGKIIETNGNTDK